MKELFETMGSLNEVLHKAFEDIVDITITKGAKDSDWTKIMKVRTKNATYWFPWSKKKKGWCYDGWSRKIDDK